MTNKRRGRGEGGVYERNGRWCATITIGYDERGRRRRRTISAKTKAKVLQKLAGLQGQKIDGTLTESVRKNVAQWLAHWLTTTAKRRVKPATLESYEELTRLHINPHIGGVRLEKLTPAHVEAWMTQLERIGLRSRRRQMALAVLRMALNTAARQGVISRNVCEVIDKPRTEPKEMSPLTAEQAAQFLEVVEGHRWHALFVLAITVGMRQGELSGLEWDDIDFGERVLHVRRTLYERKNGFQVGPPKTKKGIRKIRLPQAAIDALLEHRKRVLADGLAGEPRVFTNAVGGPIYRRNLSRTFKELLKHADCPEIRFHDLRHTAATLMIAGGVPIKVVAETLGHSRPSITIDTYVHALPCQDRMAADAMDKLFKTA
jgi:integrase